MKKSLVGAILFVVLLIIVLFAVAMSQVGCGSNDNFLIKFFRLQVKCFELPKNYTVATSTEKSVNQTENWKTYKNSSLGFEVQYPNDWLVSENLPGNISIHSADAGFNVTYKAVYDPVLKRNCTPSDCTVLSFKEADDIKVDGVVGKIWEGTLGHFTNVTYVVLQKAGDQKLYMINMESYPKDETLKQILSTFKFLK